MRSFWSFLLLLVLTACAGVAPETLAPPEVRLVDLLPARVGLLEQELEAKLRIVNPNTVPLEARGIRVTLETEGTRLGRGVSDRGFTVPALGETVVAVPLYVSTADLVERILGLAAGRGITYRLSGDILLARGFAGGTTALPFESEAALRLPRLPGTS